MRVKVEGLKELEAQLARLSKGAARGALRRAGVKSLQPMAEIARGLAPKDTEELSKSITVAAKAVGGGARSGRRSSEP